jgi:hypothetical protein
MLPTTIEEVEITMKYMALGKSPGLDGFTTNFFHKCWKILSKDIWEVVEESKAARTMFLAFNSTFISLITKEKGANTTKTFRLISLYSVICKIVLKLIANRLKPLLQHIIYLEKGGLWKGVKSWME